MNKVIYQITGKEQESLKQQLNSIVMSQNAFFAVVQFIANREGLDLSKVQFNQNELCFVTVEIQEVAKE